MEVEDVSCLQKRKRKMMIFLVTLICCIGTFRLLRLHFITKIGAPLQYTFINHTDKELDDIKISVYFKNHDTPTVLYDYQEDAVHIEKLKPYGFIKGYADEFDIVRSVDVSYSFNGSIHAAIVMPYNDDNLRTLKFRIIIDGITDSGEIVGKYESGELGYWQDFSLPQGKK